MGDESHMSVRGRQWWSGDDDASLGALLQLSPSAASSQFAFSLLPLEQHQATWSKLRAYCKQPEQQMKLADSGQPHLLHFHVLNSTKQNTCCWFFFVSFVFLTVAVSIRIRAELIHIPDHILRCSADFSFGMNHHTVEFHVCSRDNNILLNSFSELIKRTFMWPCCVIAFKTDSLQL